MTFTEALRLALARAMFRVGLGKLGGFMLPEGSVMLVDGGATLVFRHDGRVETRKGRGSNSEYPTCHAMCHMPVGSPTSQLY
jgi:hypothetical protein